MTKRGNDQDVHELRDADDARRFLVQGLWLQRTLPPKATTVTAVLNWAYELAAAGEPLPPIGFVADVAHLAFGVESLGRQATDFLAVPGWDPSLQRRYEDYVLGKFYVDWSFERAAAALCQYHERDRARGLAFLLGQVRQRAEYAGVVLSPSIIKTLLTLPTASVLAEGWETLDRDGFLPVLADLYESLVTQVRNTGDLLGPEDVFELEHGTALAQFGQRVALRQVLQIAARFEAGLPTQRPRARSRRQDVATHVLDEDVYPVGGFSSISTRGSIESLLHSQLAYMETDDRPDLFDVKFLRDELLYYSRDENQFLRQRRTFVIVFEADLARARYKDRDVPVQRIVLLLAFVLVVVRKLTDWLSSDALVFECLLLTDGDGQPLAAEAALLRMLLREQIANGTVLVAEVPPSQIAVRWRERSRRSRCLGLLASTAVSTIDLDELRPARVLLTGPRPELTLPTDEAAPEDAADHLGAWAMVLERLLAAWL